VSKVDKQPTDAIPTRRGSSRRTRFQTRPHNPKVVGSNPTRATTEARTGSRPKVGSRFHFLGPGLGQAVARDALHPTQGTLQVPQDSHAERSRCGSCRANTARAIVRDGPTRRASVIAGASGSSGAPTCSRCGRRLRWRRSTRASGRRSRANARSRRRAPSGSMKRDDAETDRCRQGHAALPKIFFRIASTFVRSYRR
jgi:hypothetical protein